MFRRKLILNNKKGITLITLIVTIIILLILAGVALNFVLGENGILRHAEFAKEKYENKAQIEQNELAQLDDYISNGRDTITISKEEYNILKNANSYSTTEKVIGTWTNGKPIYQKSFTSLSLTVATGAWGIFDTGIAQTAIENYIDCKAVSSDGVKMTVWCAKATGTNAQVLNVRIGGNPETIDTITIQYTKKTDTATNN